MIRKLVRAALDRAGYEISRKPLPTSAAPQESDDECARMIRIVRSHTMVAQEGLVSLYDQVRFCETQSVPGDFVECGVWKGGAVGLMALVNLQYGSERRDLHLFDSFQEICEPDERVDGQRAVDETRRWAKSGGTTGDLTPLKGFYDHRGGPGTVAECKELLEERLGYDPVYLHYHQGWFQEALPAARESIERIAILRIDADWHASTKVCLDHLFAKVVSGGFVIIDDYGAYEGCRKAVDGFIRGYPKPLYLNSVNKDIRYIIVP
jgi:hypothetical protein